jgi:hypothetical protein
VFFVHFLLACLLAFFFSLATVIVTADAVPGAAARAAKANGNTDTAAAARDEEMHPGGNDQDVGAEEAAVREAFEDAQQHHGDDDEAELEVGFSLFSNFVLYDFKTSVAHGRGRQSDLQLLHSTALHTVSVFLLHQLHCKQSPIHFCCTDYCRISYTAVIMHHLLFIGKTV